MVAYFERYSIKKIKLALQDTPVVFIDEDILFYHYRDKDKKEVDIIIENANGDCFAIEIKAAATLSANDFAGIFRFKEVAGKRFKFAVLLYDGDHATPFRDNIFAVPLAALWS